MESNHIITVTGRQRCGDTCDKQQFTAPCTLLQYPEAWYLKYTEIDENNGQTRVTLKLTDHRAVMLRSGAIRARMEFEPRRRTACDYDTGAGVLPLQIDTRSVTHNLTEKGGTVRLIYTLYHADMPLSDNEVEIRLRPVETEYSGG